MIRRQVLIPAPPEDVWAALVDPDQSEAWMGGRLDLSELAPGAPLSFTETDGSRWDGSVSVVRPERYLRFRWWPAPSSAGSGSGSRGSRAPGSAAPGSSPDSGEVSEVSYLLEPEVDGTRLTVQEQEVGVARASLSVESQSLGRWTRRDDAGFNAWARVHSAGMALARG